MTKDHTFDDAQAVGVRAALEAAQAHLLKYTGGFGANKEEVALFAKIEAALASTAETEVQDTRLVGGPPDLMAMSGSVQSRTPKYRIQVRRLPRGEFTDEGSFWPMVDGENVGEDGRCCWPTEAEARAVAERYVAHCSADIVGLNRGVQTAYGIARDILRPSPCPQEAHDPCVWPRCDCAPRTLNEPQAAPDTGPLTKLAAECHRAKWQFDISDEHRLTAADGRAFLKRAFAELHKIGDMALKARDELRSSPLSRPHRASESLTMSTFLSKEDLEKARRAETSRPHLGGK